MRAGAFQGGSEMARTEQARLVAGSDLARPQTSQEVIRRYFEHSDVFNAAKAGRRWPCGRGGTAVFLSPSGLGVSHPSGRYFDCFEASTIAPAVLLPAAPVRSSK